MLKQAKCVEDPVNKSNAYVQLLTRLTRTSTEKVAPFLQVSQSDVTFP